MNWISDFFLGLSSFANEHLPEGPINSLIANGIIPGIGGIAVFAPQIGILLYFLYLLEDSGYMARVIFLMDRFLRPFEREKYCSARFGNSMRNSCNHVHKKY